MSEAKYLGLTANQLAKVASDLETENSELREQGARLFDKTLELGTENAKLRELVRIAVKYCDSGTCDGCPIMCEDESCPYSDMARGLGVEVD